MRRRQMPVPLACFLVLVSIADAAVWEAAYAPTEGMPSARVELFACARSGCESVGAAELQASTDNFAASIEQFSWLPNPSPLTAEIPSLSAEAMSSVVSLPHQFSPSGTRLGLESLQAGDGLVRVSATLVGAPVQPASEPPQQLYAAVDATAAELVIACPSEIAGAGEPLSCWTRHGPANYTPVLSGPAADGEERGRLELPDSADVDVEQAAVELLLHRLVQQQQLLGKEASAVAKNGSRLSSSRGYVGGLYFLLAIATILLAVMAAALLAWALPLRMSRPSRALMAWLAVVLTVTVVVSAAGGLAGWIAVASILAITILSSGIAAAVLSHRAAKQVAPASPGGAPITQPDDPDKPIVMDSLQAAAAGRAPYGLNTWQTRLLCGCFIGLVILLSLLPAIAFTWNVQPYTVWDRSAGKAAEEVQPQSVAKALLMAYGFDELAVTLRLGWMLTLVSSNCGETYSAELTDTEKDVAILDDFVDKYSIDMDLYEPSDYRQYSTVNEWFTRPLAPGVRPVAPGPYVVSPADSRVVVYPVVPEDLRVWLKSQYFSVKELLDGSPGHEELKGGSLAILRLAPQDYHRFHSHMAGTVLQHREVEGPLYSVFADAIRAENGAIFNQRTVSLLQGGDGRLSAFVSIGATCVGSVVMSTREGQSLEAGQEFGMFQFGGSTVVLVFPPGAVEFDWDLVQRSEMALETYLHMGQRIGRWL